MITSAYKSAWAEPATLERHLFVTVLVLLSAVPFLLGTQPQSLDSAEEVGILSGEGDATKQAILGFVYAGLGVLLLCRARLSTLLHLGAPMLLLLFLCFTSALWSDMPFLALRRAVALAGTVIVGLYAGLRFDVCDLMELLWRVVAIVLVASFALAAIDPSLGLDSEGRLRGVFAHKNGLGVFASLGLLVLLARVLQGSLEGARILHAFFFIGCLLALVLAQSASPLPALGLGLVLLIWLRSSRGTVRWSLVTVFAVVCAVGFALPLFVDELGIVATTLGRDVDYSGRDRVWEFSIELFKRNPWLGYGYDSVWNGPAGTLFLRWAHFPAPHAHNGYLQLALDTGSVGLALLFCAITVLTVRAAHLFGRGEQSRMAWPIAFVGFYLLYNVAEAYLWTKNDLLTVLLVYVAVRINVLSRSNKYPGSPVRQATPQSSSSGVLQRSAHIP